MQAMYERCCGIDVHKRGIVACLRNGKEAELRSFNTLTCDLKGMATWLKENGCEIVAMESTGTYWKPIYNMLELQGIEVMVVNAQHMRNVPGRKTDAKDAEWISELLQHGLLKASYIPSKDERELREIVRYRKSLVEERSREINRLEKTLEGANIKLSSYVSSITGVSSRKLLGKAMTSQVTEENIEALLHPSMRAKKEDLVKAMDGMMTDLQKRLVTAIQSHIDDMSRRIADMDDVINGRMRDYEGALKKLVEMPGIARRSAETILSEIGMDMSRFPTAPHICSWSGLSPGNNESAGKRKNGRTCKGNKTLKTTMIQCAKSAVKNKESFFHAQYERLVVRRGANRATVAVAHSMLIAIYHMLKYDETYVDLGSTYYTKFNTKSKVKYHLDKLKELGVTLPVAQTI